MIQNMKGGIMNTETMLEEAIAHLKAYKAGGGNWNRGVSVELAQRIADATGRDGGDVFDELDEAAR
jgi:hypothetical protein